LEGYLARGGDPQAVVAALVDAGMPPEAARMAVTAGQLPELRQVLAEEAARRLQFGQAQGTERVLRPIVRQTIGEQNIPPGAAGRVIITQGMLEDMSRRSGQPIEEILRRVRERPDLYQIEGF
jgi:hypothetical protein